MFVSLHECGMLWSNYNDQIVKNWHEFLKSNFFSQNSSFLIDKASKKNLNRFLMINLQDYGCMRMDLKDVVGFITP